MSERRKFTDTFGLGDEVAIIRDRHGWHDGDIGGPIVAISDYTCTVQAQDCGDFDGRYEIPKPKDIRLISKASRSKPEVSKK